MPQKKRLKGIHIIFHLTGKNSSLKHKPKYEVNLKDWCSDGLDTFISHLTGKISMMKGGVIAKRRKNQDNNSRRVSPGYGSQAFLQPHWL
jgi:hypothetical protein